MENCCEVEGTSVSIWVWIWDGFAYDAWNWQTMFILSTSWSFFFQKAPDSFTEESWSHQKFARSLPSSGHTGKVLTSLWAVTFISFPVLSLCLPPPYAKANTIDFCIKSLQKVIFPWVSTIIWISSALIAHVVEMCVFLVLLSTQSLGTAPVCFPELWGQLR